MNKYEIVVKITVEAKNYEEARDFLSDELANWAKYQERDEDQAKLNDYEIGTGWHRNSQRPKQS